MKIIVAHKYYYEKAGAERYVFDSIKLLEESGHEVIPFAMHHPKNRQTPWSAYFVSHVDFSHASFFEKIRIPFRMIYSLEAKNKFRALIQKVRPDVVHIHNIYHQISPSILDVCREYKIPVVQTIHDYKMICPNYALFSHGAVDEGCKGGNYMHDIWNKSVKNSIIKSALAAVEMYIHHAILKIYERNVQVLLMPSRFALEKFAEFGVPREKMMHLPYPIDVREKRRDSSLTARNDSEKYHILAYGRLSGEKGFDILIRAMKNINARLDIIGDGPIRNKLEELILSEGVSEKVVLHGFQSREYIRTYMDRAACVVVPSVWYEVFPYSILETYVCGKAVVASRIGGMKELVEQVNPDYLFIPGDSDDCARVITEALTDLDMLDKFGEKGRLYIEKECNSQTHIQRLLDVYARLIGIPLPLDKNEKRA